MSAENLARSRRWFDEVWNARSAGAIDELMSPDGVGHMETGVVRGPEEFRRLRDEFLAALPDLAFELEDVVGQGDAVVVRWRAAATHAGEGLGLEPTHHPVEVRGMTWHRYRDGLVVEGWDSWNQDGLFRRLAEGPPDRRERGKLRREGLSARLAEVRRELLGDEGGPELARRLDLPARAWADYEAGAPLPAEVLLDFLDQTGASPHWLRSGEGPKYTEGRGPAAAGPAARP